MVFQLRRSLLVKQKPFTPASEYHPDTIDLQSRIITAGASISVDSLDAVDEFVTGCYTDGLRGLIKDCGVFVGDSLNAAQEKLWYVNSSRLTAFGLVEGDYSETSGIGPATVGKYFELGDSFSSLSIGSDDSHVSAFFTNISAINTTVFDMGLVSTFGFYYAPLYNGNVLYRSFGGPGTFSQANNVTTSIGHHLTTTSGTTGSYHAHEGVVRASDALQTGAGVSPTPQIRIMTGPFTNTATDRVWGAYTIGDHLTSAQTTLLNNRLQTLMASLGRI